jgi:hypothetical protein
MIYCNGLSNIEIRNLCIWGAETSQATQNTNGGTTGYRNGVKLIQCNTVNIHDCLFGMLDGDGISSDGGTSLHVQVYNNEFTCAGHDGVQVWSGNDWRIYNNLFGVMVQSGVRVGSQNGPIQVDHNTFVSGYGNSGRAGIIFSNAQTNVNVHHNVFENLTDNYWTMTYSASGAVTIQNNIIYDVPAGYSLSGVTVTASNNTIYQSYYDWGSWGFGYVDPSTPEPEPEPGEDTRYNGSVLPALTSPTNGATVQTVGGSVQFSWSDENSTSYHVYIARDAGFTDMAYSITTSYTATTQALAQNTTYYWRVSAHDDVHNSWTANTTAWSFTTSGDVAATSGVYGFVYDTSLNSPIRGVVVTLSNLTWSQTYVTDSSGYYSFSVNRGTGTYYLVASAIDYQTTPYQMPINVSGDFVQENIALTKSPTYFQPNYVKFIVSSPWGTRYSDVNVSVYKTIDITSAILFGQTDSNGEIVFKLDKNVEYTLRFYDTIQNIDTSRTLMPTDPSYTVWVWSAHKKDLPTDNNTAPIDYKPEDLLRYGYTQSPINTTYSFLNISLGTKDGSSITSFSTTIYEIVNNTTVQGALYYSTTESSFQNTTRIVILPNNKTYAVHTEVRHPYLSYVVTYHNIVEIRGSGIRPEFDLGYEDQWNYWVLSYTLMLLMGGLFGMRTAKAGALLTLLTGLFCVYAGWIQPNVTGSIMIGFATLLVLVVLLRSDRQ